MEKIAISKRYAKAIYESAKENNQVFEVFETLHVLLQHFNYDDDFRKFLTFPNITAKEKEDLIAKIYQDIKSDFSHKVLDYLLERDKITYLKEIYEEYSSIYYKAHEILVVIAIFPKELTETQKLRLKHNIEKWKKKEAMIHYIVDKTLIGGGILKINDDIIDGSIKNQLKEFKNR